MHRVHPLTMYLLLIFLFLQPLGLDAGMYKWKDSNGVTHFSDEPPVSKQNVATKIESLNSSAGDEGVVTNRFGMTFKYIKPGQFMMSSYYTRCCNSNIIKSPHQVTLTKGFYIQTTEVTQRQWSSVANTSPSYFKDCGGDCPVETVSWDDIQDFIAKLNKMNPGKQYRLPTEAEWEYAASTGAETKFGFGDNEKELANYGWYWNNSGDRTHPVARKRPNPWGLYDMHGNVWEFCQDGYFETRHSYKPRIDPKAPSNASRHVVKGGSFRHCPNACMSGSRCYDSSRSDRAETTGFRLVLIAAE